MIGNDQWQALREALAKAVLGRDNMAALLEAQDARFTAEDMRKAKREGEAEGRRAGIEAAAARGERWIADHWGKGAATDIIEAIRALNVRPAENAS